MESGDDPDVVGAAFELCETQEVASLGSHRAAVFTEGELAYAHSKPDPERRLAARLAAKRAAVRLLGEDLSLRSIEVVRGGKGPPELRLTPEAEERVRRSGAQRVLVSLTHGRSHAAAAVLLLRAGS